MKFNSKNRRPMLAMIAASALMLGGAAMPNITLHNATLLYMGGQVRIALGDKEGGLQMIGAAAAQRNDKSAQPKSVAQPQICNRDTMAKPAAKTAQPKMVSMDKALGSKQWTAMREFRVLDPGQLVKLAQLKSYEVPHFDEARMRAELQHAAREQHAERAVRGTLAHVRSDLERRGIAVPPQLAVVPFPPGTPVTNP